MLERRNITAPTNMCRIIAKTLWSWGLVHALCTKSVEARVLNSMMDTSLFFFSLLIIICRGAQSKQGSAERQ